MERDNVKAPTIVAIDQRIADLVIPAMEESDFYGGMESKDRFALAFAVGFKNNLKLPLSKRSQGTGAVRMEYLTDRYKVLMRAVHYSQDEFRDAEVLRNARDTFSLAEQYANSGFEILENDLSGGIDPEEIANRYVQEMDGLYEKYTGKVIER